MARDGPSFFKIMLPRFSQHNLRIPPGFVKHIGKEAFERATLRGTSGCCWPVTLYKDTNGIFLTDGLRCFLDAHFVKDYEVLIFTYEGKMCFNVKIFGKNGLERAQVPVNGDLEESISLEQDSGDDIESETEPISKKKKRCRPRKDSVGSHLKTSSPLSDNGIQGHELGKNLVCMERRNCSGKKKEDIIETSDEEFETKKITPTNFSDGNEIESSGEGTSNLKRKAGGPRKYPLESRSLDLASGKFCSTFPFFEMHMDQNRFTRMRELPLPVDFYQKYLPKEKMDMILRNEKGDSWEVKASPVRKTSYFYGGWFNFLKENNLKLGDHCVFELVKKTEMQVHIFRKSL